jgi:hypothetical protein
LIDHGIPKTQVELRLLLPKSAPATNDNPLALRHRIAILGDLSPIDPASLTIQLPTHLAVYAAARDHIADEYLTIHVNAASDILRRALARANVTARHDGAADPALRDPMLRVIRDVLIPTLPLLTLAETLANQNLPLRLIGDWTGFHAPGADVTLEPFPAWNNGKPGAEIHWNDCAILLHLSPAASVSPYLWSAIANGVAIVAPQHPTDILAGSLPSLLKPNTEYARPTPAQLFATLKLLLRDSDRRSQLVAAATRTLPAK